ncbi:hypothetical protein GGI24_002600 [Coemansia furcata]|nr:hypothetical protein GGI24_002600 [Coemansia furcata]
MLIVRKVVEYLEGRSRTHFDHDIDKHNATKAVLTPLLYVIIRLSKTSDDVASTTLVITKEKAVNFGRSLLQLTSAASSVSLRLFVANEDKPSYKQFYDALVSELHHVSVTTLDVQNRPDQVTPTLVSGVPLTLGLHEVSELTSITYGPEISCAHFARPAYLNASTQKILDISIAEEKN